MSKRRILVAKFGGSNGRICFGKHAADGSISGASDITSGCTEAKTIIDILERSGKFDIGVLTKILDKDWLPDKYEMFSTLKLGHEDMDKFFKDHPYDYMLVVNGSINCFGGAEDAMIPDLCIYRMMHYFPGKIFYCQCDLALNMLEDVYGYISKKPWASKYKPEEYDLAGKDIEMITQACDVDAHMKNIIKDKFYKFPRDKVKHFSFYKYPVLMDFAHMPKNEAPEYDLGYGGTLRGGRRIANIVKMYFNYPKDINVLLYGKLLDDKLIDKAKKTYGDDMVIPKFAGTCQFKDNAKVLNKALATVVIGDAIFEETQTVQQRAWQAMCANVVAFIDSALDPQMRMFKDDDFLCKFMHVSTREDVEKRLRILKKTPELRDRILDAQHKMISFDINAWCNELADVVTGDAS